MTTRDQRWRRIHAGLTIMWIAVIVPGVLWWRSSIPFLVLCSVYANAAGHWAAYEAARPTEDE
jgi:hypothetical protein